MEPFRILAPQHFSRLWKSAPVIPDNPFVIDSPPRQHLRRQPLCPQNNPPIPSLFSFDGGIGMRVLPFQTAPPAASRRPTVLSFRRSPSATVSSALERRAPTTAPSLSSSDAADVTQSLSSDSDSELERRRSAVLLLLTYLVDTRTVTMYSAKAAPNGANQLGISENQMPEELLVPSTQAEALMGASSLFPLSSSSPWDPRKRCWHR